MPIDFSNQQPAEPVEMTGAQAVAQMQSQQQALATQDVPPPNITLDDILSDSNPAKATNNGSTAAQPDAINELAKSFGIPVQEGVDSTAALMPVLELIAKGGQQQAEQQVQQNAQYQSPQPVPGTPQQSPQAPQQQIEDPANIRFDDLDLGEDASPQVAAAFKQLAERSNAAVSAASAKAEQATRASAHIAAQAQQQAQQAEAAEQAKTVNRAVSFLDSLASPKYGVGENRSLVQNLASEQVMRTAGTLIRGMRQYGQELPIEQVVQAAIAMNENGQIPVPAQQAPTPQGGLTPTAPQGHAPPVSRSIGSAGGGGSMMADAEYLAGARAILAR